MPLPLGERNARAAWIDWAHTNSDDRVSRNDTAEGRATSGSCDHGKRAACALLGTSLGRDRATVDPGSSFRPPGVPTALMSGHNRGRRHPS